MQKSKEASALGIAGRISVANNQKTSWKRPDASNFHGKCHGVCFTFRERVDIQSFFVKDAEMTHVRAVGKIAPGGLKYGRRELESLANTTPRTPHNMRSIMYQLLVLAQRRYSKTDRFRKDCIGWVASVFSLEGRHRSNKG